MACTWIDPQGVAFALIILCGGIAWALVTWAKK